MRIAFIMIAFGLTNIGFTQSTGSELCSKAFDFYHKQDRPDSALIYFLQCDQQCPETNTAAIKSIMAGCYRKLGDLGNAEKFYLQCLSIPDSSDLNNGMKTYASASLSDVYMDQGKYREALQYLELSRTEYKPRRRECPGLSGYISELLFSYKKSICYAGLGRNDSAIQALAPVIFRPRSYGFVDTKEYEKISHFFVNIVMKVYGATHAKQELQQAMKKLLYQPAYRTYTSMGGSDITMFSVDCSINFANTKIRLDHPGGRQVFRRGEIPETYSKETLLADFMRSPAYQYIMTCESEPVTQTSFHSASPK